MDETNNALVRWKNIEINWNARSSALIDAACRSITVLPCMMHEQAHIVSIDWRTTNLAASAPVRPTDSNTWICSACKENLLSTFDQPGKEVCTICDQCATPMHYSCALEISKSASDAGDAQRKTKDANDGVADGNHDDLNIKTSIECGQCKAEIKKCDGQPLKIRKELEFNKALDSLRRLQCYAILTETYIRSMGLLGGERHRRLFDYTSPDATWQPIERCDRCSIRVKIFDCIVEYQKQDERRFGLSLLCNRCIMHDYKGIGNMSLIEYLNDEAAYTQTRIIDATLLATIALLGCELAACSSYRALRDYAYYTDTSILSKKVVNCFAELADAERQIYKSLMNEFRVWTEQQPYKNFDTLRKQAETAVIKYVEICKHVTEDAKRTAESLFDATQHLLLTNKILGDSKTLLPLSFINSKHTTLDVHSGGNLQNRQMALDTMRSVWLEWRNYLETEHTLHECDRLDGRSGVKTTIRAAVKSAVVLTAEQRLGEFIQLPNIARMLEEERARFGASNTDNNTTTTPPTTTTTTTTTRRTKDQKQRRQASRASPEEMPPTSSNVLWSPINTTAAATAKRTFSESQQPPKKNKRHRAD